MEHTTSKAVIACDSKGHGCVLWYTGSRIKAEIEEYNFIQLGDLGLDDAPHGISIWEGDYIWIPGSYEYPHDGEMTPNGVFRTPTAEEWACIRDNRSPW